MGPKDQASHTILTDSEASACYTAAHSSSLSASAPAMSSVTSGRSFDSGAIVFSGNSTSLPGLSGYYLLKRAGRGGQGTVWIANDTSSGIEENVAIKIYRDGNESLIRREVKNLLKVRSPHVVGYRRCLRTTAEELAIIMEYIDGHPLDEILQKSPGRSLPWDAPESQTVVSLNSSTIIGGVLRGLASLHSLEQPIVHRDVKPANIMITASDGRAVLIDLGLSKQSNSNQTMTNRGAFLGTPGYMSPEMADGIAQADELDTRVDVWAAGVVLHEMLSGERLFPHAEVMVTANKIRNFKFQPLSFIQETVPGLNMILKRMLEVDRGKRYQNAAEVLDSMRYFLEAPNENTCNKLLGNELVPVLRKYFLLHWRTTEGTVWADDEEAGKAYWAREVELNKKAKSWLSKDKFMSGNTAAWDITALCTILLWSNVHPLSREKHGQEYEDICLFREWRNKLSHANKMEQHEVSRCAATVWGFVERHQHLE